jgi:transposase-like protein
MGRARRSFTKEFKAEAVRLVREAGPEGKSIGQIAKDLDIGETSLRAWVQRVDIDDGKGPPGALTTAEREELVRLRRDNRVLHMEREILKRAATFFAKENS